MGNDAGEKKDAVLAASFTRSPLHSRFK